MGGIHFEFDLGDPSREFERILRAFPERVRRETTDTVNSIALVVEGAAKVRAGYRTGNLRRNIRSDMARFDMAGPISATVGVMRTAPYAIWTHEGTGLFGRYKRPILPKRGKYLVFEERGRRVFARSVKGQRANPFMREAYEEAERTFVPVRLAELAKRIGNLGVADL